MTADFRNDEHTVEPVSLQTIDPDLDASAAERFVTTVMRRAAANAAPPSIPRDPLYGLWSIPHRALIAASFIGLAMLGVAVGTRRAHDDAPSTIADATGVPPVYLSTGAARP